VEEEELSPDDISKIKGAGRAILRDAKKHDIARSHILIAKGGAKNKKRKR
jgi:hypothetical protein